MEWGIEWASSPYHYRKGPKGRTLGLSHGRVSGGVLNAIIHRDYTSSSDSIEKIFGERIEVYNPGRLPAGLTVEKLLNDDYRSSVRNRKLADMLRKWDWWRSTVPLTVEV